MMERCEIGPSPWGEPIITRADASKLLRVTAREMDQLGLQCCFAKLPNGKIDVVYEPTLFIEIMARMRGEMSNMEAYVKANEALDAFAIHEAATEH